MDEKDTNTTDESTQSTAPDEVQTSNNQNMTAALTYAFGWISGLIFLLTEKNDETIRFHAAQSVVTFGAINIFMYIPILNLLGIVIAPATLVLWVFLMYKAYNGEMIKLPIAGEFAEKIEMSVGK